MRFRPLIMSIAVVLSIGVSASIDDVASAQRWKRGWQKLKHTQQCAEKWCKENPYTIGGAGLAGSLAGRCMYNELWGDEESRCFHNKRKEESYVGPLVPWIILHD